MKTPTRICGLFLIVLLSFVSTDRAFGGMTASFQYPLSNFSGPVPSQWAKLTLDRTRNEIYALNQRENDIRIFNEHGMEVFVFGEGFGSIADLAVGEDGSIFTLPGGRQTSMIRRYNYRGEQGHAIPLKNLPGSFSHFRADQMKYRESSLYLLDSNSMKLVVVDTEGFFKRSYDFRVKLKRFLGGDGRTGKKDKVEDLDINGFDVGQEGDILFTIASLFSAYRMSPDGELVRFGRPGGAPGKFGVVGGIASDERGTIYVSDRLRCRVLVFDKNLKFQGEFGSRGPKPSDLIAPNDLVVDRRGYVFVAQAANRGVSVFRVVSE